MDPTGHNAIAIRQFGQSLEQTGNPYAAAAGGLLLGGAVAYDYLSSNPDVVSDIKSGATEAWDTAKSGAGAVKNWFLSQSEDTNDNGNTFRDSLGDIEENPDNWDKTGENTQDSTNARNKGGNSIEEEFTNKNTGDKIWKHTLRNKDGQPVEKPHYRPYPKQINE